MKKIMSLIKEKASSNKKQISKDEAENIKTISKAGA